MIVAILGATGRTGRLVVQDLLARGHQARVLVRRAVSAPADTCAVVGDARDPAALRSLVDGCDVVISALGPVGGDRRLHREVAPLLIAASPQRGFVLEGPPPPVLPPQTPSAPSGGVQHRFEPAPLPNRDLSAPLGPRATNDPQFGPKLFHRGDQYRGEGIDARSSAQSEQERRLLPGAGFNLRIPQ